MWWEKVKFSDLTVPLISQISKVSKIPDFRVGGKMFRAKDVCNWFNGWR